MRAISQEILKISFHNMDLKMIDSKIKTVYPSGQWVNLWDKHKAQNESAILWYNLWVTHELNTFNCVTWRYWAVRTHTRTLYQLYRILPMEYTPCSCHVECLVVKYWLISSTLTLTSPIGLLSQLLGINSEQQGLINHLNPRLIEPQKNKKNKTKTNHDDIFVVTR